MLFSNQINGIYGGVNQQTAVNRLDTQVEEMTNAYPTLNEELLKRNPTKKLELSQTITYTNDAFYYKYDRGDVDASDEKYSVQINATGIEIVDLVSGTVQKDGSGLTYEGTAKNYITSSFGGQNSFSCITIKDTTFVVNKTIAPTMLADTFPTTTNNLNAFIWIKSADPQYGYTYSYSIKNSSGTFTGNVTDTNTVDVASALSTAINAHASLSATVVGSVVKITSTSAIQNITITDTFGNQASRGFIDEVSSISDLPATLGFSGTVIKIVGTAGTKVPYYVIYDGVNWKETLSGSVKYKVDTSTMPHVLIRESDGAFTFKEYDGWVNRTVGDDDVTPIAPFLDGTNPIKDIFFLKNRLGFITENTVEFSEVAQYGNFFRTTALSYLDSDPISINLNTTQSVNLEYAVTMEDSLMLTSSKYQFRLKTVDVLTYETIEFIPSSAYEINVNVRPLFMNNRVFFVVKRGDYSAVMEFYLSSQTNTIAGDDITAHCQRYIDGDISQLSGSPINNMLFLSKPNSDTVYVYKYYDSGNTRVQSAWFKWTFNGTLYSTFTLGKKLYILINRKDALLQQDWVLQNGFWNDDNIWCDTCYWVDEESDVGTINQVEYMSIFPQDYKAVFLDNDDTLIPTNVLVGEWVPSVSSKKQIGNIIEFKTVQIDSEEGSSFNLYILDTNRNTRREVSEKYTIGRKPFVGGRAKDIKIGFESTTDKGFRISSVVFEGNVNTRNRRL